MWRCPKCRSKVEDSFDLCWSCGTTRDGVEDPNFTTADQTGAIEDPAADLDVPLDDSLEDFAGIPLPDLAECFMAESTIEAKFVADRLMEQGIPAVADSHDINMVMGGFRPLMWGYGPKVRVLPKDLIRARTWVIDYEKRRKEKGKGLD